MIDASLHPIFVIGLSGRCGSSLIQRMIHSSGVKIYGEIDQPIKQIFDVANSLDRYCNKATVRQAKTEYEKYGYRGWIARLCPNPNRNILTRSMILNYINEPNNVRWGFKSITMEPYRIMEFHRLFPEASFVFVYRNYKDVITSAKKFGGWSPQQLSRWKIRINSMKSFIASIPPSINHVSIDYDEHKNDFSGVASILENALSIDQIDREFLKQKIGSPRDSKQLYGGIK